MHAAISKIQVHCPAMGPARLTLKHRGWPLIILEVPPGTNTYAILKENKHALETAETFNIRPLDTGEAEVIVGKVPVITGTMISPL